jgi:hypothetical protein
MSISNNTPHSIDGERLGLTADGVGGPDGVVTGVTEADADSIVAHTHRQSPRRRR